MSCDQPEASVDTCCFGWSDTIPSLLLRGSSFSQAALASRGLCTESTKPIQTCGHGYGRTRFQDCKQPRKVGGPWPLMRTAELRGCQPGVPINICHYNPAVITTDLRDGSNSVKGRGHCPMKGAHPGHEWVTLQDQAGSCGTDGSMLKTLPSKCKDAQSPAWPPALGPSLSSPSQLATEEEAQGARMEQQTQCPVSRASWLWRCRTLAEAITCVGLSRPLPLL